MINYEKLMELDPTVYTTITNRLNQILDLVEHPLKGDEAQVIVISHELKLAFYSDFFDTEDMEGKGDYEPLIINRELLYGYQVED